MLAAGGLAKPAEICNNNGSANNVENPWRGNVGDVNGEAWAINGSYQYPANIMLS